MKRKIEDESNKSEIPEKKNDTIQNNEKNTKKLSLAKFKLDLKSVDTDIKVLKLFNALSEIYGAEKSDFGEDVLQSYLQSSPECTEIFKCLAQRRSTEDLTIIYESLLHILIRTVKTASLRSIGHAVCTALINQKFSQIEFCINCHEPSTISVALKLLSAMVLHGKNFAKQIAQRMNANSEGLPRISKVHYKENAAEGNEVRINFVHFILSFLMLDDIKTLQHILETTNLISLIFTSISSDPNNVVNPILNSFTDKIVKNSYVSKTAKVNLFSGKGTLMNISYLFEWNGYLEEENAGSRQSTLDEIRNLTYNILESICCSFKLGINFYDKSFGTSGRNANKTIFSFITQLKSPQKDNLKTKLIAKTLSTCPDLLGLYFKYAEVSFDPGTSDHWVLNCVLFREIYQQQTEIPAAVTKYMSNKTVSYSIAEVNRMAEISLLPCTFPQSTFKTCLKSPHKLVKIGGLSVMQMILKKLLLLTQYLTNPANVKQSKFSQNEIGNFLGNLKDKVLSNIIDLTLLTNMCSNSDSNIENKHVSIFHNVVICMNLYSDNFPENFARSTFDFSGLLGGLYSMVTEQKNMENVKELEKSYLVTVDLLMKNPQAYMWFKTTNKQKSPFFYLLKILANPLTKAVAEMANKLMKQILTINLIYDENTVDEFDFWINGLSHAGKKETVNTCLVFLSDTVGLIARKPYKFLDIDDDDDKLTKEAKVKSCGTKWWKNLPDVIIKKYQSDDNQSKSTRTQQNISPEKRVSSVLLAFFENLKSADKIIQDKIDVYLSSVVSDLVHSTKSIQGATMYLTAFSICENIDSFDKNWKYLNNVIAYVKKIINKNPKTTSLEIINTPVGNFMQWFTDAVNTTQHDKIVPPKLNMKEVISGNQKVVCVDDAMLYINQILLYIDIANKIIKADEKCRKVCLYHLVKLLFDVVNSIDCKEDEIKYYNLIATEPLVKDNFLKSKNVLSEFLTPKILECVGKMKDTKNIQELLQRFTDNFVRDLPKFLQESCAGSSTSMTVKVFPTICRILPFHQLQAAEDCVTECYYQSTDCTETTAMLFHSCIQSIMSKTDLNSSANFPGVSTISAFCDMLVNDAILENSKHELAELFHLLTKSYPGKTVPHFTKSFMTWCLEQSHENEFAVDMLTYCACEINQIKNLSKLSQKMLPGIDSVAKIKLLPFVVAILKRIALNETERDKEITQTIFNSYKFLIGRNLNDFENCDHRLYSQVVKLMLQTMADQGISEILLDGLKAPMKQNSRHAYFMLLRIQQIIKFDVNALFDKSSCDKFFKKSLNVCFLGIQAAITDKLNDSLTLEFYKILGAVVNCAVDQRYKRLQKNVVTFWKEFFTASLRHFMGKVIVIDALQTLVEIIYKNNNSEMPISVIRKMIIGHSNFLEIVCSEDKPDIKLSLLRLLKTVSEFCDSTSFDENDYIFLFGAYQATLQEHDLIILGLLKKYEENHINSDNFKPYLWGTLAVTEYSARKNLTSVWKKPGPEHFMSCINSEVMSATITEFPIRRRIGDASSSTVKNVYDPEFLLPLCHNVLDLGNFIDCRMFISSRVLSFLLMCLSSHCNIVRSIAISCLGLFYKHVESGLFSEKNMLIYVLQLVRNEMEATEDCTVQKLSTVVSKFMVKTVELLITPGDHMYSVVCKYLLIKPRFDLSNVPEFYALFFSSKMEHRIERRWILNLLSESILDTNDYHLIEKRKTSKLLFSFYNSTLLDKHSQRLILKILGSVCKINGAVSEMVLSHGILAWLKSISYTKPLLSVPEICEIVQILANISGHYTEDKINSVDNVREIKNICFLIVPKLISLHSFEDNTEKKTEVVSVLIMTIKSCINSLKMSREVIASVLQVNEMHMLFSAMAIIANENLQLDILQVLLNYQLIPAHSSHHDKITVMIHHVVENFSHKVFNMNKPEVISLLCSWLQFWATNVNEKCCLKSALQNSKFNFLLKIENVDNLKQSYQKMVELSNNV